VWLEKRVQAADNVKTITPRINGTDHNLAKIGDWALGLLRVAFAVFTF